MHGALAEAIDLFAAALDDCDQPEDRIVVERYLAALAPVLSGTVLGSSVFHKIRSVEHLFENLLLTDQEPFQIAFEKWRQFKREYVQFAVGGMTVNERLYAMSLLADYDRAVAEKNTKAMRLILEEAHVDPASIEKIVEKIEPATEIGR